MLTQPKLSEAHVNTTSPRRIRHSWEDRCRCVDLILQGDSPRSAAVKCGIGRASAYRYKQRFEQGGYAALRELPPIAKSHPRRTSPEVEAQIIELRQTRGWAPRMISNAIGIPHATVSKVLRRAGLSRKPRSPKPAPNRYEYAHAGAMIHLDAKKLGRFHQVGKRILKDGVHRNPRVGWHHVHVAIDDHSRYLVTEIYPAEDADACTRHLRKAVNELAERGIRVERVMTDNGSGYRSHAFKHAIQELGLRHIKTKPYTPRTNGKAEAVIRILQREWAYAYIYPSSKHRAQALSGYTRWYNNHRPHGSLGSNPPITRVSQEARHNT